MGLRKGVPPTIRTLDFRFKGRVRTSPTVPHVAARPVGTHTVRRQMAGASLGGGCRDYG
jgi:hypothetical protein